MDKFEITEEQMEEFIKNYMEEMKPYHDAYTRFLERPDRFYALLFSLLGDIEITHEPFDLYDYENPYWIKRWNNKQYSLIEVEVMLDILSEIGERENSFVANKYDVFTRGVYAFKLDRFKFVVEVFCGQGETHKMLFTSDVEFKKYAIVDLEKFISEKEGKI